MDEFYYKWAWTGQSRIWSMCFSAPGWLILFQVSKIYSKKFIRGRFLGFSTSQRCHISRSTTQFVKYLSLFTTNWLGNVSLTPYFPVLLFIARMVAAVLRAVFTIVWKFQLYLLILIRCIISNTHFEIWR